MRICFLFYQALLYSTRLNMYIISNQILGWDLLLLMHDGALMRMLMMGVPQDVNYSCISVQTHPLFSKHRQLPHAPLSDSMTWIDKTTGLFPLHYGWEGNCMTTPISHAQTTSVLVLFHLHNIRWRYHLNATSNGFETTVLHSTSLISRQVTRYRSRCVDLGVDRVYRSGWHW